MKKNARLICNFIELFKAIIRTHNYEFQLYAELINIAHAI